MQHNKNYLILQCTDFPMLLCLFVVMRCPDLYPPSPQMSPATSVISTHGNPRFGGLRHGPSPLSTRTLNSSTSQRFTRRISNGLSEDSDEEDPPPYPGVESMAQPRCHHNDQLSVANSRNDNSNLHLNQISNSTSNSSLAIDNTGLRDSLTRNPLVSSPHGSPSTSPSLCLSELGEELDNNDEHDTHVVIVHNDEHNNQGYGNVTPESSHSAGAGSDAPVPIATSDSSIIEEGNHGNDVEDDDVRNRLDSQGSIIGTVV